MFLNTLSPAPGAKKEKRRLGRGIGSGLGKTGGRGHKGLKSRSGGKVRPGFEGGQMPLKQRLPKFGFTSRKQMRTDELRSGVLNTLGDELITLDLLKAKGLVQSNIRFVKVFNQGEITRSIKLKGIRVAASVKAMIEKMGGSVE